MLTMLPNILHIGIIVIIQILMLNKFALAQSPVDCSYCKKYSFIQNDPPNYVDESGRPIIFIGGTNSRNYYLMNQNYNDTFFDGMLSTCARYGLQPASIITACDYCIFEKWFLAHNPTTYSVWVGGFRMGSSTQPQKFWIEPGCPLDFSQFNLNAEYIQGYYPPGGYSPIVYPWQNCLSVNRNCPLYSSGHQNPCQQTATYPPLQFVWADCRNKNRVACQETSYSKEGEMNEIEYD